MAANLFWVGETGVEESGMARGVEGDDESVCAEFLCRAKKGSVRGRGRIIGDSLFLPTD